MDMECGWSGEMMGVGDSGVVGGGSGRVSAATATMRLIDEEEDEFERSMLEDMQLAAELGKTLLDRNRELESTVREQQATIEDQAQEIEYLTKQTAALREVNDSRLGIYEHLEASITELERSNHRLVTDAIADKKLIRNLSLGVETLEGRCEELQRTIDQWEERARNGRLSLVDTATSPTLGVQPLDVFGKAVSNGDGESGEMTQLLYQIQDLRAQRTRDRRKIEQMEEETTMLAQENLSLEEQLALVKQQRDAKARSIEEEVQMASDGNGLCVRCLAVLYANDAAEGADDVEDEDETNSMASGSIVSQTDSQIRRGCLSQSPYQTLVDKFEALLQVQRKQALSQAGNRQQHILNSFPANQNMTDGHTLSLHEELQMSGDFSGPPSLLLPEEDDLEEDFEVDDVDERSRVGVSRTENDIKTSFDEAEENGKEKSKEIVTRTHSEAPNSTPSSTANNANSVTRASSANHDSLFFSEAETASSGFSDDPIRCIHRSTQTDDLIHSELSRQSCQQVNIPSTQTEVQPSKETVSEMADKSAKKDGEVASRRGTLLCSITEGEDVHVSIYDEALPPTKSRFVKNHPTREVGSGKTSDLNGCIAADKQSVGDSPENRRQMFREIFAVLKRTLMEARESSHLDDAIEGPLKTAPAVDPQTTSLDEKKVTPADETGVNSTEVVKEVEGEKVKLTPYRKASREDAERMSSGRKGRRGEGRKRGGNASVCSDKNDSKQMGEDLATPMPAEPAESSVSADESQTQTSVKRRHHRRGRNGGGKALLVAAVTGNHHRSQGDGTERCSWPLGGPAAASSPSAEMARLMRLERSYADALRLGAPRKEPTQVWGRGGGGFRGAK